MEIMKKPLSGMKIVGAILVIIGVLMLISSFQTARGFITGNLALDQSIGVKMLFLIIMAAIAVFLTTTGLKTMKG